MKKKILTGILCAGFLIPSVFPHALLHVEAEGEENPCGEINTAADLAACEAYRKQLASDNEDLSAKIAEIEAERKTIAANIAAYQKDLETYQAQLDDLNAKLSALNAEISQKQAEINNIQAQMDEKQVEIDETNASIQELSEKVKSRMVNQQSTMKFNSFFEILMGAKSFSDLIRIANGISAVASYDQETNNQLIALNDKLKVDKQQLDELKAKAEEEKAALVTAQAEADAQKQEVAVAQAHVQVIKDAAEDQAALLEAQGETIAQDIASIQATIANSKDAIAEYQAKLDAQRKAEEAQQNANNSSTNTNLPSGTSGWVNPVPNAYRSAGTWNYPGGGIHLGYDFAAGTGSPIYAVADGYVLKSANGCSEGYLGSSCHGFGGSNGGGNQVYLLVTVGENLYAVKYLHMQLGSPISQGTWVSAGTVVGRVGATGNVTGPHCHIEIFYLGSSANFASYLQSWNGDLAFGAGWAGSYGGYGRRCESGYGAPCRIRPETVVG